MTHPQAFRLAIIALRVQIHRLAYEANLYRVYRVPYAQKSAQQYQAYQQALEILQEEIRGDAMRKKRNRHAKKV